MYQEVKWVFLNIIFKTQINLPFSREWGKIMNTFVPKGNIGFTPSQVSGFTTKGQNSKQVSERTQTKGGK